MVKATLLLEAGSLSRRRRVLPSCLVELGADVVRVRVGRGQVTVEAECLLPGIACGVCIAGGGEGVS